MKLIIVDESYIVKENNVTCRIEVKPIFNYFNKCNKTDIFVATAFCRNNDKFDFNIGKKVSLAKAENEAYKYYRKRCKTIVENQLNTLQEVKEFINKANNCISHNIEYMKKF